MSSIYQGLATAIAGEEKIARVQELWERIKETERIEKAAKQATKKHRKEAEAAQKQAEAARREAEAADRRVEATHQAWTRWNAKRLQAEAKGEPFNDPPPELKQV